MKKTTYYITIITLLVLNFGFSQQKNSINVNGLGKVTAFPNAATITLELDHIKPTLREAVNENQKTLTLVKTIIKNINFIFKLFFRHLPMSKSNSCFRN